MEKLYDVIIVGAGPAGGSAGIHCAKNSLKTLIIEDHDVIGEPVHCGECLSTYATKNTGINPPESVISEHVKGVRVIFPDGTNSVLNEDGFVLEKEKFEQWLSEEAEKNGAEVKLGTRLLSLERKNGIWELQTSKGALKTKIVIDASGVSAVVSRLLKLNERFEAVIGIQYELRDIPRDGYLDFYIWPELAPEGYLWMIPKGNGRANVGLVTTERNKARVYNEEFVKRMKWDKKVNVKTFGGLIPASGPLKNTYSEGLMLIGDAAGFTSPLFEGGSHLGLKSGQMAADVAKEAVSKNDFSTEMFSNYEKLWKAEFPQYEKLIVGKKAIYSFTDEELNFIAKNFPRNFDEFNGLQKIIFGLKVLVKKPGLLKKGFLPAMKAFEYSQAKFYGW
ncbi:MAG TPA: NAD(P)/FAD-dependent oxidoreductase [archaeon]|nr:NAD(P)/FAD-dependent oxidoreductase [archaeon]